MWSEDAPKGPSACTQLALKNGARILFRKSHEIVWHQLQERTVGVQYLLSPKGEQGFEKSTEMKSSEALAGPESAIKEEISKLSVPFVAEEPGQKQKRWRDTTAQLKNGDVCAL